MSQKPITNEIKMTAVKSSNVEAIGYSPELAILVTQFKGGSRYLYFGVPQEKYNALASSTSVGKFLGSEIKPNFSTLKVPEVVTAPVVEVGT